MSEKQPQRASQASNQPQTPRPRLAPGKRPRTGLYGAPLPRPATGDRHRPRTTPPAREPSSTSSREPPAPIAACKEIRGDPFTVSSKTAEEDFELSVSGFDFGTVVVGEDPKPRDMRIRLVREGRAVLDSFSAVDYPGVVTFLPYRFERGSSVDFGRAHVLTLRFRPTKPGPIERTIYLEGTRNAEGGSPHRFRLGIPARGCAVAERPAPLRPLDRIVVEPIPAPKASAGKLAAANQKSTGIRVAGFDLAAGEALRFLHQSTQSCLTNQLIALTAFSSHQLAPGPRVKKSRMVLAIEATLEAFIGGASSMFAQGLKAALAPIADGETKSYASSVLAAAFKGGLKSLFKAAIHRGLPSAADRVSVTAFASLHREIVNAAKSAEMLRQAASYYETLLTPGMAPWLGQLALAAASTTVKAEALQYRCAVREYSRLLSASPDGTSQGMGTRLHSPHLTRGARGLLQVHMKSESGLRITESQWPGFSSTVVRHLVDTQGKLPLISLKPSLRVHVTATSPPGFFSFEKHFHDNDARVPKSGTGGQWLTRLGRGTRALEPAPALAAAHQIVDQILSTPLQDLRLKS